MNNNLKKAKLPPQALEFERAILGALLIDNEAYVKVMDVFDSADVFYKPAHQMIFEAVKSLYGANSPIDLLTVSDKLNEFGKLNDVGGDFYLIELSQKVGSSAHCEYHARIVLQKYISRRVIKMSNSFIELAYRDSTDIFDLLDHVSKGVDGVEDILNTGYTAQSWDAAVTSIPKRVESITNNQGKITGVPTGLKKTDRFFSGWQPTDFIVIGADSGMGKTAFVFNNVIKAAKAGFPVGMFSMEMSVVQLAIRGVAIESEFHLNQLMRNGFEKDSYFPKLAKVVDDVKGLPIYIDDQPNLTTTDLKRKTRAMHRKHGIKILFIDFLQMFGHGSDIRHEVSAASRLCKNLAKELNIPVIALSQLSRDVRRSKFCIPHKNHLKESSAIEEAADVIGLLYRPAYYGYSPENNYEVWKELDISTEYNAAFKVAKNRNGGLGVLGLNFVENKTKFVNKDEVEDDNPFVDA